MSQDGPRKTFSVYVIRLSSEVLAKRKFAKENPGHDPRKPCVYVGMTGLTPEARFARHKADIQACDLVRDFGEELIPRQYEKFNPMTYDEAKAMEVELARRLRKRGYAVWQK